MPPLTAVLDACVLYPAPLRDFFMHLALVDLFRARWTDEIHREWIRNVLLQRPDLKQEQLQRTRELMNLHVRDALVEGYEGLVESLILPDNDDRHVLAAAMHSQCDFIVTFNLRDFPIAALEPYRMKAIHPDEFVMTLFNLTAERVHLAAERQRQSLKNPPKTRAEYWQTLETNGLAQTVRRLQNKH